MIVKANAVPPHDFAALFPAVLAAADAGDSAALAILTQAGAELARLARIVMARLFGKNATPMAMAGGVFRNSALVRQVFYNSLRSDFPDVIINPEVIDPVNGALAFARRGSRSTKPQ
jgi:N-acetylglucosamine kinase-like BadF-type ATPase